jgi:hypothetical protein
MAQYRKKPVVIEAFEFRVGGDPWPEWFAVEVGNGNISIQKLDGKHFAKIKTLEGVRTAMPGDWIIQGVKGEIYPCKTDIFAATYERVDG